MNPEDSLVSRLLYLDSSGIELTPAGKLFLHHARVIMPQVEYMKCDFSDYSTEASGYIRILANTTAATEFLPEILAGWLAETAGVTVDLQERMSRHIVRGVMDGSTDMGIIAGLVKADSLQVIHFSTYQLVVVTALENPLATRKTLKPADTLAYPHIGLHKGTTLLRFLSEQVALHGQTLYMRIKVYSFKRCATWSKRAWASPSCRSRRPVVINAPWGYRSLSSMNRGECVSAAFWCAIWNIVQRHLPT